MTEQEIIQNAEAYADSMKEIRGELEWCATRDDFITGAHSRDEEITTLEGLLKIKEHEIKQLRNPWISVNERLPEEFQMVFVCMQGGYCDCKIYTNGFFEQSLQLKCGTKDDGYTIISWLQKFKSNITHWMPIPELKKGE